MSVELTKEELDLLKKLKKKFSHNPTEFAGNLEGLLHARGVSYWEYINIDNLLNLQHPKTNYTDEMIFIVYHQITELYFKLIQHELDLLTDLVHKEFIKENNWIKRLGRIINYFNKMSDSFDILLPGKEGKPNQNFSSDQFLKFRLSLMPASGFQTVSFRKIEIMSTGLHNLISHRMRKVLEEQNELKKLYYYLYWKEGGRMVDTFDEEGEMMKTKTLMAFEEKYDKELLLLAEDYENRNLEHLFFDYSSEEEEINGAMEKVRNNELIKDLLNEYDEVVNKSWKGVHMNTIRKHMESEKHGTGGTNWKEFLPPRKQQICYFPSLK